MAIYISPQLALLEMSKNLGFSSSILNLLGKLLMLLAIGSSKSYRKSALISSDFHIEFGSVVEILARVLLNLKGLFVILGGAWPQPAP